MRGSWAGAMGQNQFMPSTYLGYAVDFDGDGHRDIWRSLPDVFASMANYLDQLRLGRPLHLGPRGDRARRHRRRAASGLEHRAPLATWEQRGVRLPDGGGLPDAPTSRPRCCAWTAAPAPATSSTAISAR